MPKNNTLNTPELMTGKDGRLFVEFNGKNVFLAEINTFAVNMNVNTTEKQPVGSILVHRIPTGVTFDLTYTEMVVRDDLIMEPLLVATAMYFCLCFPTSKLIAYVERRMSRGNKR